MLKKIILASVLFFSCFVFIYAKDVSPNLENPFGLDDAKIATIKKLYETEGLVNGWFKDLMQDFVKYAKKYDKEKVKSEETKANIKNTTIKMLVFSVFSSLVVSSFNDQELSAYAENSGLIKALDSLSEETTNYLDKLGNEVMGNLGLSGGEIDKKILNQYVDITINSINEHLNSKVK